MHRPILQHGLTTRHHLWLCLAVVLGLGTQTVVARECHRETPLPADVRLIAPGPQVPEAVARFAGVWVEEVFANGFARVLYSHGASLALNVPLPGFWRVTGRIVDGALRFHLPIPERPEFTYRVAGEMLEGTLQGKGHVRLTRMADVDQVGCGPQAGS